MNVYMVKTDSTGTLEWDRAVEISPDDDDVAYSVEEASDGYIVVGRTDQVFVGDTTSDIFIFKTSTAGVVEWLNTYGEDALVVKMAATLFGSTETTLYVLAVYFGAVGVRRTRYAIQVGLLADATGAIAAVIFCNLLFT